MKIRRMLTEILLEVTDQEIDVVANEVVEEEKSKKHQCIGFGVVMCVHVHYYAHVHGGLRLPTYACSVRI